MNNMHETLRKLDNMGACGDAQDWLEERVKGSLSPQVAWNICPRGDWMLWLLERLIWRKHNYRPFGTEDHRKLIGCVVEVVVCNALPFWSDGNQKTLDKVVDILTRYVGGDKTVTQEIRQARRAANAAAYATDAAAAAAYAAYAAAYAAYAAVYAADAAAYATDAANAATAATDATANAARNESQQSSADIVRLHYPTVPNINK